MKSQLTTLVNVANQLNIRCLLIALALVSSLTLPTPAMSALVNLATSPLATSTTSTVKPNLLFIIDNSGSMVWDHMPDDLTDGGSDVPLRMVTMASAAINVTKFTMTLRTLIGRPSRRTKQVMLIQALPLRGVTELLLPV